MIFNMGGEMTQCSICGKDFDDSSLLSKTSDGQIVCEACLKKINVEMREVQVEVSTSEGTNEFVIEIPEDIRDSMVVTISCPVCGREMEVFIPKDIFGDDEMEGKEAAAQYLQEKGVICEHCGEKVFGNKSIIEIDCPACKKALSFSVSDDIAEQLEKGGQEATINYIKSLGEKCKHCGFDLSTISAWECSYCGKPFDTEKECDAHEEDCDLKS